MTMKSRGRAGGNVLRMTDQEWEAFQRRTGRRIDPPGAAVRPEACAAEAVEVELEVPPGVNDSYANVPGKGRVLTERARDWKRGAVSLTQACARQQGFRYPEGARLRLSLGCRFPHGNRDLDGVLKIVQDALAEALGFNDRVVDEVHLYRGEKDPAHPRLHVTLSRIALAANSATRVDNEGET
jgi:Holliday junction resolvase RusA-like endonuclease